MVSVNGQRMFSWRAIVLAFFIGSLVGGFSIRALLPFPGFTTREAQPAVAIVDADLTKKKEIVYIEKAAGEHTDVQIDTGKPKVTINVNGKEQQYQLATKEMQKFEKGKLVIAEETQLRLDIKTQKPRFSVGMGWSTHGPALTVSGGLGEGPAGWWLYGDRRTLACGVQIPLAK
jgi:hypothetical protein